MRIIIWSVTALAAAALLVVYVAQQRAIAEMAVRNGLMQVEFDKAIKGLQDARTMVCDGECPKG